MGESGVGKTTLIKLQLRFCGPGEGRIVVDGVDCGSSTWRSGADGRVRPSGTTAVTPSPWT
ncbi:ATP-binding cassette domain-containing protein [Oceanithermus sp.]